MAATFFTIEFIILQDTGVFSVKLQTGPLCSIQHKIIEKQIQKNRAQLQLAMYRPATPAVNSPYAFSSPPLLEST